MAPRPLRAALMVVLALAVVLGAAPAARASTATPPKLQIGLATADLNALQGFRRTVGVTPDLYDVFAAWGNGGDFPLSTARWLYERHMTLTLTWEPWKPTTSRAPQPAWKLTVITSGRYDAYVRRWARAMKTFGHPLYVRFAHEMNSAWYPWGVAANGNTAADYRAAFRHVVNLVRAEGARNVRWVWAPNQDYDNSPRIAPLYPGDAYVDRVGMSGYNWGAPRRLMSYATLFDHTVTDIRTFTRRPIMVSETATSADGVDKAAWITQMFDQALARRATIVAVTYFDIKAQEDWRVETVGTYAARFRAGFSRTR